MKKLLGVEVFCDFLKIRKFDIDIRIRPIVVEIFDISVKVITPNYSTYDVLIVPVRQNEVIQDPFNSAKEDGASFFSSYESKTNSIVHSSYLSPDLRAMSLVSENLSRPLAKFNKLTTMGGQNITYSTSEDYVALSFMDIVSFGDIEILREGVSCILTGNNTEIRALKYSELIASYEYGNIILNGVLDGVKLPFNIYDDFCSFYYCVMHIPVSSTYYFNLAASDANNLEIDGELIIEDYTENTDTYISASVYLDKGYHYLLVRQQEFTGTDRVSLQFRTQDTDPWLDFTADNCNSRSIQIYAVPVTNDTVMEQKENFFAVPTQLEELSLNSLYLKQYRPITVLARLQSELMQKEFNSIRYLRHPDRVLCSNNLILEGAINNVTTTYNIGLPNYGVLFDAGQIETPYITYEYDIPEHISWIEITETKRYGAADLDEAQCTSFCISAIDEFNSVVRLNELIDISTSVNVKKVSTSDKSETRVYKNSSYNIYTRVRLKKAIKIKKFTISKPNARNFKWGFITTIRAYGELLELVELIDNRGVKSSISDSGLQTVKYEEIGFIPSIYKPQFLPMDLRFGGEFLMFCLDVSDGLGEIKELGSSFIVQNKDDHAVYNQDVLLHVGVLTMADRRKFNIYKDYNKSQKLNWMYVVYDTYDSTIKKHDLKTFEVRIQNTGTAKTDVLVPIICPNAGISYKAYDTIQTNIVHIVGMNTDKSYTDSISAWNNNTACIKLNSIGAGETKVITVLQGDFSPTTTMTGTAYSDVTAQVQILYMNVVVVKIDKINANDSYVVYALYDDTGSLPTDDNFDVPQSITLDAAALTELTGSKIDNLLVDVDVSNLTAQYNIIPMVIYDGDNRQKLETIGLNTKSGTIDAIKWEGKKVGVKVPTLEGGQTKILFIRACPFNGEVDDFIDAVQQDMIHSLSFKDSYKNDVDGSLPDGYYQVELTSDKNQKYNGALSLNKNNISYIRLKNSIPLIDYSISIWLQVEPTQNGTVQGILNPNPPSGTERTLRVLSTGAMEYRVLSPTIVAIQTSNFNLYDGKWHHIVITHKTGAGVKIYTDGQLNVDSTYGKTATGTLTTKYTVGTTNNIDYFTGIVDELKTYNKVLTDDQVAALYSYYDGTKTNIEIKDMDTRTVLLPANQITNLFDPSTMQGTPVVVYKYIGVDESVLRWIL